MSRPDIISKIRKKVTQALSDFEMIRENDKILVAMSGGIDSVVLLELLFAIQKRSPIQFTLTPFHVDQGFPEVSIQPLRSWLEEKGIPLEIKEFDTYTMITDHSFKQNSPCAVCSRLRRGILYSYANEHGYTKIALGHHRDDLNETLLMNMLYAGRMAGMPPKLKSRESGIVIIRPMCYLNKKQIQEAFEMLGAPIVENRFCEEMKKNTRGDIRTLLTELAEKNPKIPENLAASQKNIRLSQLSDQDLWDFTSY